MCDIDMPVSVGANGLGEALCLELNNVGSPTETTSQLWQAVDTRRASGRKVSVEHHKGRVTADLAGVAEFTIAFSSMSSSHNA